jgi:hypothetical protein
MLKWPPQTKMPTLSGKIGLSMAER